MGRWAAAVHYRRSLASRVTLLTTMAVGIAVTGGRVRGVRHGADAEHGQPRRLAAHARAAQAATPTTLDALQAQQIPPWALGAADVKIVFIDAATHPSSAETTSAAAAMVGGTELRVARGRETWSARTVIIDGDALPRGRRARRRAARR